MERYRIRPCAGNQNAWCLIALRDDGSEIDSNGGFTTAYSLDGLLKYAGHLTPKPGDHVELVPMQPAPADPKADPSRLAGSALVASIHFSNELIGIVEMLRQQPGMLSALNASATIQQLRGNLDAMKAFVDLLDTKRQR